MDTGHVSRAWHAGYAAGYAAARGWAAPSGEGVPIPAPSSAQAGWEPLLADLERGRIVLLPTALVGRYRPAIPAPLSLPTISTLLKTVVACNWKRGLV